MNKSEFVQLMGRECSVTSFEAEKILNKTIGLIYKLLSEGREVNFSGFGKFSVSHRESRIGVNPRNPSEKITIPALDTPKFKAGEAFKEAVKLKSN